MRKLILAAVLTAGVLFPLASQAEVSAFGVNVPVERQEVTDGIRGGTFAEFPYYPISTQRLSGMKAPAQATVVNGDAYTVQGIHLSSDQVI
ncbi:MAG TPA: hypothetical protein PKC29_14775 [Thermodesulfobacteriota bacterium]|nr:hypothetical protein [Thermodesulfobacteriota bacterium]